MTKPFKVEKFGGLDTYHPAVHQQPSSRILTNLYTDGLSLKIRGGKSKLNSSALAAADVQGLHMYKNSSAAEELLAICNGVLYKLNSGGSKTEIKTGLGTSRFRFSQFGDNVYFCDGDNVNGVYKYNGTSATLLTSIAAPASALVGTPTHIEIDDCDAHANWATSDAVNFTKSQDTSEKMEGTGSVKVAVTADNALGDTLTLDLGGGNEIDLAGVDALRIWIKGEMSGVDYVKFGFGEGAWNENTLSLGFSARGDRMPGGVWGENFVDISYVADTAKNAVRYFGFECLKDDLSYDFWIDYLTYSGGMHGEYEYRYTYYDVTSGIESNPSDSVTVQVYPPENQSVTLTNFTSPGATADKYRIYRKGGNDWVWRLVAEVSDATTTYTDSAADYQLGTEQTPYQDPPSKSSTLCFANSRMFYGGNPSAPNRLYISNFEDPDFIPTLTQLSRSIKYGGRIDIGSSADAIKALKPFGGAVLILKNDTTWALTGDSFQNFAYRQLFHNIGCTATDSIAGQDALYWLHGSKVYRYDGQSIQDLTSMTIGPDLESISEANKQKAVGGYYDRRYYIFFPDETIPVGYVWDERSNAWSKIIGWTGEAATIGHFGTNPDVFYLGDEAGYVWKTETGTADGSTAISFEWESFNLSQNLETTKRVSNVRIVCDEPTILMGSAVYDQEHQTAQSLAIEETLPGQTFPEFRVPIDAQYAGKVVQIDIEGSTSSAFSIHQVQWDLDEKPSRN